MHSSPPKACRYFVSNQESPFESIGCIYLHSNLSADEISIDESTDECTDDENEVALVKLIKNQCNLRLKQLKLKDDLFNHVQSQHEVYFLGIMKLANKPNQAKTLRDAACLIGPWSGLTGYCVLNSS